MHFCPSYSRSAFAMDKSLVCPSPANAHPLTSCQGFLGGLPQCGEGEGDPSPWQPQPLGVPGPGEAGLHCGSGGTLLTDDKNLYFASYSHLPHTALVAYAEYSCP